MSEFDRAQNYLHQQNMLNLQRGQNLTLKRIEENTKKQVDSVKEIATSAQKTANKADIKGWISVIIALLAFLLELSGRLGLF